MGRDRIISPQPDVADDERTIQSLRPKRLTECVGQESLKQQLVIAMEAAKKRGEPLDHLLLDGPPGLGKTTIANVVAEEMGTSLRITSGPAIVKQADLMTFLTNMEVGEILFIDEIHRLPRVVEEFIYPAMEDFRIDFTVESGLGGRTVNFALNRFTLIGATTRAGMLSAALRDRFGVRLHFDFYTADELTEIVARSARRLELDADDEALRMLAARSRGTPRVANRLLQRTRDYAQVRADGSLTPPVVDKALDMLGVDALGLDDLDRNYLRTLMNVYNGGPAGIEALAASMGQERDTLEDMVEPYLLQIAFVVRTRQGRQATREAYKHLALPFPEQSDHDPVGEDPSLF
jgi:Holliday junction DNA helicase RuvB